MAPHPAVSVPRALTALLACCAALLGPAPAFGVSPASSAPVAAASLAVLEPGDAGPYRTARFPVFRGWERVEVDLPLRVEDLVEVTAPVDRQGRVLAGQHPVVVLLHGRHQWCSNVGGPVPNPVPGWCNIPGYSIPVPSYTGYRYLADRLASQGRIVVSVSANGINAQDNTRDLGATARALLLEYHLDRLARANERSVDGYRDRLVGRLDLSRTVLMGHSRGGEGVVRAAQLFADTPDNPFALAGVIPLAPVSFAQMAPPTVPTFTILPACDGDVSDQQGQTYVDRGRDLYGAHGALNSSVWVPGANHNYFNTEWTPGMSVSGTGSDDAEYIYDDTTTQGSCRPEIRLTPEQERAVGLQYMAAAVRYAQDADSAMLGLFDGTGSEVPSLASEEITVRSASLAGPDRLVLVPRPETVLQARGLAASLCRGTGLSSQAPDRVVCATGVTQARKDTMWLGSAFVTGDLPGRTAVDLSWTGQGQALADLPSSVDLRRASRLSARVVLDPSSTGTVLLAIRDADGRVATAPTSGLPAIPLTQGSLELRLWAQTLWTDPARFTGVDLSRIEAVGLATTGSGRAWIVDMSRRTAQAAMPARPRPVAELRDYIASVPGGTTRNVPVTVVLNRPVREPGQLRVQVSAAADDSIVAGLSRNVRVRPGMRRATVYVPVTMPTAVGPGAAATVSVAVYPLYGVTVGMFRSTLTVVPVGVLIRTVTLPSPNVTAPAGGVLQWDFVADRPGRVAITAVLQTAGMDYSDLDPEYRQARGLPASGPIEAGLSVRSVQVDDTTYRISLPLSATATSGANVTFGVTSVTGATAPTVTSFSGQVM